LRKPRPAIGAYLHKIDEVTAEASPMTRRFALIAVAAALAALTQPRSPAAAADLTVKNVKLGTVLHGPPVSADDLTGAVVFVEEWGIH
jgi:hypothetical protein